MILGGLRNAFTLVLAIEDDLVNKGARVQVDLSLLRSSKKRTLLSTNKLTIKA